MPIPSPAFSSSDVATECQITPPWSSNHANVLATLADGALPYSSSELAGRTFPDYIPAAVAWADFSSSTDDSTGSNSVLSANQTISAINQTITLRVDTTNWSCTKTGSGSSADGTLVAYVNAVAANTMAISHSSTGASTSTFSNAMTFNVVSTDVVRFELVVNVSGIDYSTGQTGATFSVKNQSSSNTVLDTFVATCSASFTP